jgi:hypothetical protein
VRNKIFTFDDNNTMTINTKWVLLQIRDILVMKAYWGSTQTCEPPWEQLVPMSVKEVD